MEQAAFASSGATSNTPLTSVRVRPDWVRFSFVGFDSWASIIRDILAAAMGGEVAFAHREKGLKGFRSSLTICLDGEPIGTVGLDNHGKDQIDLPGRACGEVVDWPLIRALCEDLEAKLTRVDLAADFGGGEVTPNDAFAAGQKGLFRLPSSPCDPFDSHRVIYSPKGSTFYVGTRGDKLLRCYEKGKELGITEADGSPSKWVRVEVEYGQKSRVLVPDMLVRSAAYFAAAYPWCSSLVAVDAKACPPVARVKEVLATRALAVARQQVGRLVSTLSKRCGWPAPAIMLALRSRKPSDRVLVRGAEDRLRAATSFDGLAALLEEIDPEPAPLAEVDPFQAPSYELKFEETTPEEVWKSYLAECARFGWSPDEALRPEVFA